MHFGSMINTTEDESMIGSMRDLGSWLLFDVEEQRENEKT